MNKKSKTVPFCKLPNTIARSSAISLRAFRVFGYLVSLNPAFPSYRAIRKATGLANETITKAIKELCVRRIVSYVKGGKEGGANFYYILPSEMWNLSELDSNPCQIFDNSPSAFEAEARQILESNKTNPIKPKNKTKSNNKLEDMSPQHSDIAINTDEPFDDEEIYYA